MLLYIIFFQCFPVQNFHTQHCHNICHTHTITHNIFTHNTQLFQDFHTQLFHTQHCHSQLFRTQFCHIQPLALSHNLSSIMSFLFPTPVIFFKITSAPNYIVYHIEIWYIWSVFLSISFVQSFVWIFLIVTSDNVMCPWTRPLFLDYHACPVPSFRSYMLPLPAINRGNGQFPIYTDKFNV